MKTKKRFLSILLSLVMVLGLMPGMSLTAYADDIPTAGISPENSGTVEVVENGDDSWKFTATPASGYEFDCWKANDDGDFLPVSDNNPFIIDKTSFLNMSNLTAVFKEAAHTHSFSYSASGATITASVSFTLTAPAATVTEYPLWVGGTRVTSANASDVLGAADEGATVTFTPATEGENPTPAILTLNNASITTGYPESPNSLESGIYYEGMDALDIVLADGSVNSIIKNSEDFTYGGIYSTGEVAVTISGTGELTVKGSYAGINAGKVTIKSGSVSAEGLSVGISALNDVTIEGGTVSAVATTSGGHGIIGGNDVTINDGVVIASATGADSDGIKADSGIVNITGGTVTASGTKAIVGTVKNAIPGTGWTNTAGTTGEAAIEENTTGQSLTYKKVQFKAVESHTVTFNANGGTGTMQPQIIAGSGSLNQNTFTRSGQIFVGWNTKADGTGASYSDGGWISGLTSDITLYAQWIEPNVTVGAVFKAGDTMKFAAKTMYVKPSDMVWSTYGSYTVKVNKIHDDYAKISLLFYNGMSNPTVGFTPAVPGANCIKVTSGSGTESDPYILELAVYKDPATVISAPTAKALTANGSAQALVIAGMASGGTMQYALGADGTTAPTDGWAESIPTGTNAGSYYVWYKAVGDDDHNDSDAACVTVTVAAAPAPIDHGVYRPASVAPAATTVTVSVSGEDATVNVKVEVKGDAAAIKEADVDKVLGAEDVGTVTVDVSGLKDNVDKVTIPGAMVDKIADAVADEDNSADRLEVRLPAGSVSFDAEALAAIADQADGKDLTLHLDNVKVTELTSGQQEAVSDLEVEIVLDAHLTANGKRISDFKGGSATVKIPYALKDGQLPAGLVVWYVAEDNTRTQVPATYDGEYIVFDVPHFSNYVVAYDEALAAACPKDESCPLSAFSDLDPEAWYHDGVHFCLENGFMKGMGDGLFDPDGATSRAMIVTILYRLEGEPMIRSGMPFSDVTESDWYAMAVSWAESQGIVNGFEDGTFRPGDPITREQLAAILYRYTQYKGEGFTGAWMFLLDYPDAAEISSWADEAMHWMVMQGVINGKDGKLVPGGDASRAEAATMLMRYCTKIAE